jgi:superfamily II DNA or RNA helicase
MMGSIPGDETGIFFHQGTLLIEGPHATLLARTATIAGVAVAWDERTKQWRAPAHCYRDLVMAGLDAKLDFIDHAKAYDKMSLQLVKPLTPREHQVTALKAWIDAGKRGVVQLPTGAGKTFLAILAVVHTGRPSLIVVPTIDLLHQWHDVLSLYLGIKIGALGGGSRELHDVTVATYDSAVLQAENLGNRFGLLVVDECHHLPAPQYQTIALTSIAPFRLGLSATVARADGKEDTIFRLLGTLVHEGRISQMVESVLAPYDVVSIQVPLSPKEAADYGAARAIYTGFIKAQRVNFAAGGWMEFVRKAARLPGGKAAMAAFREQKRLAQAASAKMSELWRIIRQHPDDRIIVFTDENQMAYQIGRQFLLPVLTHQTKLKERKRMLEAFRAGTLNVIVTSKVLNEGVDVPEARIGVVVSGSGGVREHVQRLGRILRHRPGKKAVLYELISKGTSELDVNSRRKRHDAYQDTGEI